MQKEVVLLVLLLLIIPVVSAQYYDPNIGQNIAFCNEGDTQCDGNVFLQCVNGNWQAIQQCEYGCDSNQGCTEPAYVPPGVMQIPEEPYEEPPSARPAECYYGEKRCDRQNFQMCINGVWQTQLTCGKYQECTNKGCKSVLKEPIPVVAPPKFVPPVEPTPAPHVESVEVEPLEIDEREMTSKPKAEYVLVVEKPKPKGFFVGVIDFLKGILLSILPGEKSGPRENGLIIDITRWFEELPPGLKITIDPAGGILKVYWLDEDGNICHGEPGISGQPGTVTISDPDASEILNDMYDKGQTMSKLVLDLYQKTRHYDFSGYDGTGSHLMHFEPFMWRIRSDEKLSKGKADISLPADLELTATKIRPVSFTPYSAYRKDSSCVYAMVHAGISPMPSPPERGPKQNPDKCKVKSKLKAKALINACLADRLEGDFSEGVLDVILPSAVVSLSK